MKGYEIIGDKGDLEKRIEDFGNPLIEALKKNFEYDFFYLTSSKEHSSKENINQTFIQFFMGNYATGILISETKEGKIINTKMISEKGSLLSFSQGPQGEVLVLLYPCSSDVFQYQDKYIIYRIYRAPSKIITKKIEKIIRFNFRFAYMTSYLGKATIRNRLLVQWIKWRAKFDLLTMGKSFYETVKSLVELKSGISTP